MNKEEKKQQEDLWWASVTAGNAPAKTTQEERKQLAAIAVALEMLVHDHEVGKEPVLSEDWSAIVLFKAPEGQTFIVNAPDLYEHDSTRKQLKELTDLIPKSHHKN